MGSLERCFKEIGKIRGRGSEELVCATLEIMVQEEEIDEFEPIEPHSDLDYKGIDFFVTIKGKRFPLQVKKRTWSSKSEIPEKRAQRLEAKNFFLWQKLDRLKKMAIILVENKPLLSST